MGKSVFALLLISFLALHASVQNARAVIVNLTNNNSMAQIDLDSSAGMFNWYVKGQDQLAQQWFWFRVGNLGPESAINTIGGLTTNIANNRSLTATYANAQFSISIDYLLTGGSGLSGVSDIAETITINYLSGPGLDFHFFQYSDFDIGGPGADTVQLGTNLGGFFNEALQTGPSGSISENIVAPGANRGQVGLFPGTLNQLTDLNTDNLNNVTGPLNGDVTWALQWDFFLDENNPTFIISKDKHLIVPEPSTWALMSAGVILFALYKRRRLA